MRDVLRWIDRHDGAPALEILDSHPGHDEAATDLLSGIVATDPREQSGIWSTASGVLAAYRTGVCHGVDEHPAARLRHVLLGAEHALPLLGRAGVNANSHRSWSPAIGDVRDATYTRTRDGHQGPPTLLALDEVANIAPVPDLPAMVSEGAGQGLLVLACLQDLSQARARWGQAADGFLSLFGTTVVFPGIADTATLRDLSALAGDREVTRRRSAARWTSGDASGRRLR